MRLNKRFLVLFIGSIWGYVTASDSTLTLQTVVELAIKQGTSSQQSLNQIEQKKLAIKQAGSDFLPEVKTSLSTNTSGKIENSPWTSNTDASIGASYTFTPSSLPAYKEAQVQGKASQYQYQQTINDVTATAVESYVKALYALKKTDIAQNNLDYQKSKLQQIEEYRSAGKKSIADVLQQQTVVAEGEASLLEAQQSYGRIIITIFNMTGLPLNTRRSLDTSELPKLVNGMNEKDSVVKEINLSTIPQIQSQKQLISAASLGIKSAKMSYFPSITGSLSSGSSWIGTNVSTTSNENPNSWSDPTAKVSLSISYPIFDQFSRKQNVQKASLNLQYENLQLQDLEKNALLQHRLTGYDLEIAKKQLNVADTRLSAAKQSLEATTQRYDAGASTLVEVAMVNNSYLSAVNSRLESESAILLAYFNMLQENGQIHSIVQNLFSSK
jgi:outer membrane protein